MQHNAFVGSLLHSRKNTERRGFHSHSFLNFGWFRLSDLNNDRFSNIEFEEDRDDIDGTFCPGVVWDDSNESLSNDDGCWEWKPKWVENSTAQIKL